MRDERLLKELTQLMGVSGFEKNVRERIEQEAKHMRMKCIQMRLAI